jgi:hypothetical protein
MHVRDEHTQHQNAATREHLKKLFTDPSAQTDLSNMSEIYFLNYLFN